MIFATRPARDGLFEVFHIETGKVIERHITKNKATAYKRIANKAVRIELEKLRSLIEETLERGHGRGED